MASIKTVERQIGNLEGFDVIVRHPDGTDARSDLGSGASRRSLPPYNIYEKAASGGMTVSHWIQRRFNQRYSGWNVDVLYADGESAAGNTLLKTVRESYEED